MRLPAATLLILLPLGPAWATEQVTQDRTPRLALISAFEPEWKELREAVVKDGPIESTMHNGIEFVTGTLEGHDVVVFSSGVSMVNAAMAAQMAFDRYNVERVIYSGIAGSAEPALDIGDVIVPEKWGQYFEVIMARERDGEMVTPRYFKTPFPNFEMMFPREVDVVSASNAPSTKFWFEVDPTMLGAARKIAGTIKLEGCSAHGACLTKEPKVSVGGNGVSGTAFVDNTRFRSWAHETFDARVLDMESAAVAHVAWTNDVPFLAVRSVSDLAGGGPGANEMNTFMGLAAGNSVTVVRGILSALD